ncbi:MAG: LamB/YcsF family protein [Rubellimicrobium sp.]|nr:LamB/YcsF family protein [Rubellimicrobium sp.]
MRLTLNADLGEGWGPWSMGDDAAMLAIVGSANVACGGHAGDPDVMRATILAARERGVSLGAHPGYPDLAGFGRRPMTLSPAALEAQLAAQIGALAAIGRLCDWPVTHVKPHGALSNRAAVDRDLADVIARTVAALDPGLILLAPALSALALAGQAAGLAVALEVFADRRYAEDGQLSPRASPGAVIADPGAAVAHLRAMLAAGGIVTQGGRVLPVAFHSICVHGDAPGAVAVAAAVAATLRADGHELVPLTVLQLRKPD